jgi:WD repeat-containing protein 48
MEKLASLNLNAQNSAPSLRGSPRSSMSIDTQNQNRPQTTTSHNPNAPNNPPGETQVVGPAPRPRPEDMWEFLCNETVLPPNMTLAVVRQYIWRQAGELVLHYRRTASRASAAHAQQEEDHRTLAPRTAASAGPS